MLSGIRVLDFTRVLAGPLCTMMLGDLGADVLKVERPNSGDETRGWGPPFDQRGESAYFLSVNRNKLSVLADLDAPADQRLLRGLLAECDVAVDNFRPGTLERRGLSPAALVAQHPRLIWCTITGFGQHNPRPGYDFVMQAERGWMAVTGDPHGAPTKVGLALADVVAGKDAAIAILGALFRRERANRAPPGTEPPAAESPGSASLGSASLGSGPQRHLWISLAASAAAALVNVAQNALITGAEAVRWGNAHPNLVPYQLFEASDRPFVVAVGSDAQWRACALALDLPELASDPALATNAGRIAQRAHLVATIAAATRERPAAQWTERLDRAGVPCGLVKTLLETLRDVDASPITGVAPSVPGTVRLPPPRLGEHDEAVRRAGWAAFRPDDPSAAPPGRASR